MVVMGLAVRLKVNAITHHLFPPVGIENIIVGSVQSIMRLVGDEACITTCQKIPITRHKCDGVVEVGEGLLNEWPDAAFDGVRLVRSMP